MKKQTQHVYLHDIAISLPEHRLEQERILAFMSTMQADNDARRAFLRKIYQASAIETRYSVLSDYGKEAEHFEFYPKPGSSAPLPSTKARNQVFVEHAEKLALQAVDSLFSAGTLTIPPHMVTHLISVSCTGFSAPGFDFAVQKYRLSDMVERYHIGFMGCFAALPALRLAQALCEQDPSAKVLIVDVELCTLHFQSTWEEDLVVANALFSDGAAAVLVSADPADSQRPLYSLDAFASRLIPQSEERMAWLIGETGFEMKLSAYVPKIIQTNIEELVARQSAIAGRPRADIGHWAIHPGGRAILDRVAEALELPKNDLSASYEILRQFGNMSSTTILFVLKELARQNLGKTDRKPGVFAAAFGPGLTVESALLSLDPLRNQSAYRVEAGIRLTKQAFVRADLSKRLHAVELMDRTGVDVEALKLTVKQFTLLNRNFASYRSICKREVFGRMSDPKRVYTLLDIGAGGGDIPLWLAAEARRRGLTLHITAMEPDERIADWARDQCKHESWIDVKAGLALNLADFGDFDFIICNHVMHHLHEAQLASLLLHADQQSRVNIVLNDLRRSRLALMGYNLYTRLFLSPSLAQRDGKLSILRGFTKLELENLIRSCHLQDKLEVIRRFPARLVIRKRAV